MKKQYKNIASVNITDLQRRAKLSHNKIRRLTKVVLLILRKPAELNLIFVSDAKIRSLNRLFHGSNRATDVLAFETPAQWPASRFQKLLFGEIVISVDRVCVYAKRFKVPPDEELMRYVVHGILHLIGERDDVIHRRNQMIKHQEQLLDAIRPIGKIINY